MKKLIFIVCIFFAISCNPSKSDYHDWSRYLGDGARSHYTTLDQIKKENLDDLEVAWTWESPDTGQMQMNPIVVDGTLYGVSAALKAFALDAETGQQKWIFDEYEKAWHGVSRGLSYWSEEDDKRILYTRGKDLLALNAETGKLIKSFGNEGRVDLHLGLPEIAQNKSIISNTPGTIFEDLIIMPVRLSESEDAAPGDIRAFNVRNGSLAWTFHIIPYPGEQGYETWEQKNAYQNKSGIGAGNNWAGMAIDEETGIVYIPTGSFAPDFYGGHRKGSNLYSNCLLALDANTGKLIWHQQLVHHDIWDRDLPAPPNLLTVAHEGRKIKAVAQITKQGYIYLFNRKNGEPLFEIREVNFPSSKLAEEEAWTSQPIPVKPEPFARRSDQMTEQDISPFAPNKEELLKILMSADKDFYSPPDTTPTFLLPGYDGGAEWGGAGVDMGNGIMYINSNEMAWILALEKIEEKEDRNRILGRGEMSYVKNCAVCHQNDLTGSIESGYPSLVNLKDNINRAEVLSIIDNGKGMMVGYAYLDEEVKNDIIDYLFQIESDYQEEDKLQVSEFEIPYKHTGYHKFLDANGLPGISPPWGTLNAIDMNSGEYLWKIPFGEIDSLIQLGHPITGTESYGGPIITKNGLLIIAATKDEKIRIFDRQNGALLWEDMLPASSFATPATYMAGGKQFIALACGGEKLGRPPGNKIIAYGLTSN